MRKISYLLLAGLVTFSACKQNYKKADEGMEYAIVNSGKGSLLKNGEFIEVHFTALLSGAGKKDSVLSSTRELGAPQIMPFDSTSFPPAYYKIFKQMKNGDSVSTRSLVDSMFKKQPESKPPFMVLNKKQYIYTNIKITNVYKTQAEADSARKISMAAAEVAAKAKADALVKEDDKTIGAYLAKNNIKATKTANGVYVQTTQAGTGALLDSNVFAKVMYTGKTLDGKMFDSNVDPSKGHTDPLSVNLTNDMSLGGGVIPGMSEALKTMQKGTKAVMYIPSGLGYGARGAGADIPANANLMFEVEVLDVMTKAQAKADNAAQQAKMMVQQKAAQAKQMADQKKYIDSLEKADPKAAEQMKQQMQQQMMQQMQEQQGGGQR
jgi:FKBP-type peptidyl-prolyl cis-trans isomerase FkpA